MRAPSILVVWMMGCGAVEEPDSVARHAATAVAFSSCEESIGVGLVATEQAQALVPPSIMPVGAGTPVTPLVVRTAHCRIDRGAERSVVQVGLVIVPPAEPGTIDNYLLGYATDSEHLADVLAANGVAVHRVPRIEYAAGATHLEVDVPVHHPVFELGGSIARSTVPAGAFVANWWRASGGALVEMTTTVPVIANGTADLTLTTTFEPLVALAGSSVTFPVLQQYNGFATADMVITSH